MRTLPEPGSNIVSNITSIVDRLITAHTECKRINAEIKAVEAKYRNETKKIELVEKALKMQHMEAMRRLKTEGEYMLEQIKDQRKLTDTFIRSQDKLLKQSDRVLNAALEKDIGDEHRKILMNSYQEIHAKIAQMFNDRSKNPGNHFITHQPEKINQAQIEFSLINLLKDGEK